MFIAFDHFPARIRLRWNDEVALAAASGQRTQNFSREKPTIKYGERIVGYLVDELLGLQHFIRAVRVDRAVTVRPRTYG